MKKNINVTKKFEVKFNIRYICQTFFVTDLDFGFTPLSIARTVKLMGWFPIIRTVFRITIKPELLMWNMFCEKKNMISINLKNRTIYFTPLYST